MRPAGFVWLMLVCAMSVRADEVFDRLVDRFFEEGVYRFHPTEATSAGFHQHDARLEDYSPPAIQAEIATLKKFLPEFERAPAGVDRDLVVARIRASLLDLETLRTWEKSPDRYSSGPTSSIFYLMSRRFAPADERLRSVILRERRIPRTLEVARANLKNPPRISTEIALEQLQGIISFFRKDVPKAFDRIKDPKLLAEFATVNGAVISALTSYEKFLKNDLLPRSQGDFRIGASAYREKLLFEEMVDTPLDRLLEIGYQDLRANQDRLRRTAARIDANRTPQEVLADLEKDHPEPPKLLQAFRDVLGGLRAFIARKGIVTIPSTVPPILQETPPFARALTFASMDTPGPYEKVAKEAFFNVTLPEPDWPPKQVEAHMAGFNRAVILSTAIHEAFPGHYTQFLWVQQAPSKVRKLIGASSNAEGWAHYAEQMMLDEGFGDNDPKIRLGQIQDALLRNARYIAGIEMHTGKMTYAQAIEFFVKEGFQTRANGERESKRGTQDPTYLVYTLGKLQIQKLRGDYEKHAGRSFRLRDFHDAIMKQGYPPIAIVRKALLGDDSGPTI